MWMISHKTRFETEAKGNTESFVSVCLRLGELGGFVSTDCKLSAPLGIFRGFMARTRKKKKDLWECRLVENFAFAEGGGENVETTTQNFPSEVFDLSQPPPPPPPQKTITAFPHKANNIGFSR